MEVQAAALSIVEGGKKPSMLSLSVAVVESAPQTELPAVGRVLPGAA